MGDFVLFLDADDWLTKNALSSRVTILTEHQNISFVDGLTNFIDKKGTGYTRGVLYDQNPLKDLCQISDKAFIGPSWLCKREAIGKTRFLEDLTHAEDLLFYIDISKNNGSLQRIDSVVLNYRDHNQSAMSDLDGLANGYFRLLQELKKRKLLTLLAKKRIARILLLSYLRNKNLLSAIRSPLKVLFI